MDMGIHPAFQIMAKVSLARLVLSVAAFITPLCFHSEILAVLHMNSLPSQPLFPLAQHLTAARETLGQGRPRAPPLA